MSCLDRTTVEINVFHVNQGSLTFIGSLKVFGVFIGIILLILLDACLEKYVSYHFKHFTRYFDLRLSLTERLFTTNQNASESREYFRPS